MEPPFHSDGYCREKSICLFWYVFQPRVLNLVFSSAGDCFSIKIRKPVNAIPIIKKKQKSLRLLIVFIMITLSLNYNLLRLCCINTQKWLIYAALQKIELA